MDKGKKFLEIIENEEISALIESAASVDEVLAILRDNGLETTAEELGILNIGGEGDELDEAALEDVAGGGKVGKKIKSWWSKVKKKAAQYARDKADYYVGVWEGLTEDL